MTINIRIYIENISTVTFNNLQQKNPAMQGFNIFNEKISF